MTLEERIHTLSELGKTIERGDDYLDAVMSRTSFQNPWFTVENQKKALNAIKNNFLQREKLERWVSKYPAGHAKETKSVGIIMAGNIPLVGFHDLLCVFVSGHKAAIKLSEKDPYVLPYLLKLMEKINPASAHYFEQVEKLKNIDAVIATGSNNSSRYFEAYFKKYPHIIRKNRNSVAVLTGEESDAEMLGLGSDCFSYFGLGCRNVSKLYLPRGFDIKKLLEFLHEYRELILNDKYKNNFDYNFALYSLNRIPFHINGCVILLEDSSLHSRIACLHYETYDDLKKLASDLKNQRDALQCVVTRASNLELPTIEFGRTQEPALEDYADNVDTMQFLVGL